MPTRTAVGMAPATRAAVGMAPATRTAVGTAPATSARGGMASATRQSAPRQSAPRAPYAALRSRLWLIELLLGTLSLAQWLAFLPVDGVGGVFMLLYAIGLLLMGWGSRPDFIRGKPRVVKSRTLPVEAVPQMPASAGMPAADGLVTPTMQA